MILSRRLREVTLCVFFGGAYAEDCIYLGRRLAASRMTLDDILETTEVELLAESPYHALPSGTPA